MLKTKSLFGLEGMKKRYVLLLCIFLLGAFLRLYKLSENPPGLYIDEAAIGYNAYKILTTGKDEYGISYPLTFKSFGDYKMPVYIYATAGMMALFGKTEFAVRITSALAGSMTILLIYFFAQDLLYLDSDKKYIHKTIEKYLPLLSAFLLALSPWHLQFSRAGFEVNLGLFLFLLASWLALRFVMREKRWSLFLSFFIYAVSIYTYHTFRILTPVVVSIISLTLFLSLRKLRLIIVTAFAFFCFFILPLMLFSLTPQGSERFSATAAFSEYPTSSAREKLITYPFVYLKDYFSFYSLDFLFNGGDGFGRHQLPGFGVLPRWTLPFFFCGIYFLFRLKKGKLKYVTLALFFLSPIAGALARPSPHSLRDLVFVIPAVMVTAIGILYAVAYIPKRLLKAAVFGVVIIAVYETAYYFHFYYVHYPQTNIIDWGGGYKQIVLDAGSISSQYKKIVVDNNLGVTSIEYFHFYDESLKPIYVNQSWHKPNDWHFPVLYIRPYYGSHADLNVIHNIFIPNANHDNFAQFYRL